MMWTKPDKPQKKEPDAKGIETVRRDNAPLTSKTVSRVLNALVLDRSLIKAVNIVIEVMQLLYSGTIDLSQLVISKALAKEAPDYTTTAPHVTLTKRMQKRDYDSAPRMGDRVPYIMVARGGDAKKIKAHEKAEDPAYVIANNVPIDVSYYVENQLRKPIARLLEPLMPGITEYLFSPTPSTIYVPADISSVALMRPPKVRTSLNEGADDSSDEEDGIPKNNKKKKEADPARPPGWTKNPVKHLVGGQCTLFGEVARPLGEKIIRPKRKTPGVTEHIPGQKRFDDGTKVVKANVSDITKPKPGYIEVKIRYKVAAVVASSEGNSIGRFGYSLMNCLACEARMVASSYTEEERKLDVTVPVCLHCRQAWAAAGKDVVKELARVYDIHMEHARKCKKESDDRWATCIKCKGVDSIDQLMVCASKECHNFYPRSSAKAAYIRTEETTKRLALIEHIVKKKKDPEPTEGAESEQGKK